MDALYVGATGLAAQQTGLETIANNLANMNTPAYKRSNVVFEDLMYHEGAQQTPAQGEMAQPVRLGLGTRIGNVDKVFAQGELHATESDFDLAINGDGLVSAQGPDGTTVFSRAGSLRINDDGLLALRNGLPLDPPISVPRDAKKISIDGSGKISAVLADGAPLEIGQVDLALFNNPSALKPLGEGLYARTEQSGEAEMARPGEEGRGMLAQRYLEGSNVRMADELVNLMLAQRAFEANAKVLQAADEMLSISNNLRRG
jgi:flagellar basal-body rod protein FlgG